MRIGIITFHRANNYGAALQCYALQQTLTSLGHETQIIDYRQPVIELMYKPVRWDIICQGLRKPRLLGGYLFKVLPTDFKYALKKTSGYEKFRKRHFHATSPFSKAEDMPQDFDIYMIGSDQMWNINLYGGYMDNVYFGNFPRPKKSKLATYAISTDLKSLAKIECETLKMAVKRFTDLSFREKIICDAVERMTGIRGRTDMDPTLLINKDAWSAMCTEKKPEGNYLLTYFLHQGTNSITFKNRINRLAERLDCRVVNIHDAANAPDEFLSAIRFARCVVTSSFHAVAFSALFNKTFYAINSHNGREIRYESLLHSLGLSRQYIEAEELDNVDGGAIDYSFPTKQLDRIRKESIQYLSSL